MNFTTLYAIAVVILVLRFGTWLFALWRYAFVLKDRLVVRVRTALSKKQPTSVSQELVGAAPFQSNADLQRAERRRRAARSVTSYLEYEPEAFDRLLNGKKK